jgi:hypothetical protein
MHRMKIWREIKYFAASNFIKCMFLIAKRQLHMVCCPDAGSDIIQHISTCLNVEWDIIFPFSFQVCGVYCMERGQ